MGLDLGTDSVGWAVTDENLQIVRKGGKSLWGVRLFDEASSAADRRLNRTGRRRLQRRKQRITLLQNIFRNEMNKVDPQFFRKLELSKYHYEDRSQYFNSKTILFNDNGYTDKEYYNEYPTIYHLRKALIENPDKKFDIRLIYLAIHHLIKYRGNFLMEGDFNVHGNQYNDQIDEINKIIDSINSNKDDDEKIESINKDKSNQFCNAFIKTKGIKKTEEALAGVLETKDKYLVKVVCKLLSGAKVNVKDIFELESDENIETKSVSFSADFDETYEKIYSENSESLSYCELLQALYKLYSILTLKRILKDSDYLCDAMCDIYEQHNEDLSKLKKYVKENCSEKKNRIFRLYENGKKETINSYARYVGSTSIGGQTKRYKKCSADDFYKFLKKELEIDKKSTGYLKEVFDKMEDGSFLSKQNLTSNGIFPYQLNKKELDKIIENQSKYYPDLFDEKDEQYNITNAEKIIDLLEFRIPYYVGPLAGNKNNNKNFWAERKESGKIYPWNFEDKVDTEKSAKKFIERMQNKCTYLHYEFTLPKDSIIYQKYNMYNNLNKMAIGGKLITYEQKEDIVKNLFNRKRLKEVF